MSFGNNILNTTGTLNVDGGGLQVTTTPSNGQIPIGNGTNYTVATITAGSNFSVTNAANSVTLASQVGDTGFNGFVDSTIANVTGDGTAYDIASNWNVLQDRTSNFSSGTFSAPVKGIYLFTGCISITDNLSGMTQGEYSFYHTSGATNTKYIFFHGSNRAVYDDRGDDCTLNGSLVIELQQNDTVKLRVIVSGSTKSADVSGPSPDTPGRRRTYFMGFLLRKT